MNTQERIDALCQRPDLAEKLVGPQELGSIYGAAQQYDWLHDAVNDLDYLDDDSFWRYLDSL